MIKYTDTDKYRKQKIKKAYSVLGGSPGTRGGYPGAVFSKPGSKNTMPTKPNYYFSDSFIYPPYYIVQPPYYPYTLHNAVFQQTVSPYSHHTTRAPAKTQGFEPLSSTQNRTSLPLETDVEKQKTALIETLLLHNTDPDAYAKNAGSIDKILKLSSGSEINELYNSMRLLDGYKDDEKQKLILSILEDNKPNPKQQDIKKSVRLDPTPDEAHSAAPHGITEPSKESDRKFETPIIINTVQNNPLKAAQKVLAEESTDVNNIEKKESIDDILPHLRNLFESTTDNLPKQSSSSSEGPKSDTISAKEQPDTSIDPLKQMEDIITSYEQEKSTNKKHLTSLLKEQHEKISTLTLNDDQKKNLSEQLGLLPSPKDDDVKKGIWVIPAIDNIIKHREEELLDRGKEKSEAYKKKIEQILDASYEQYKQDPNSKNKHNLKKDRIKNDPEIIEIQTLLTNSNISDSLFETIAKSLPNTRLDDQTSIIRNAQKKVGVIKACLIGKGFHVTDKALIQQEATLEREGAAIKENMKAIDDLLNDLAKMENKNSHPTELPLHKPMRRTDSSATLVNEDSSSTLVGGSKSSHAHKPITRSDSKETLVGDVEPFKMQAKIPEFKKPLVPPKERGGVSKAKDKTKFQR